MEEENVVNMGSAGTPVQDENQPGTSQEIAPWTPLRSVQDSLSSDTRKTHIGVPQESLYNDLQQFVVEAYSPISDGENLPEPEPLVKKMKRSVPANKEKQSASLSDRISSLEQSLQNRLSKIEESVQQLSTIIVDTVQQSSNKQQHYCRSLTVVLQKEIKSVKEVVQNLQATTAPPEQKLPEEVIKSILDLNTSLLSFVKGAE